MVMKYEIRDPIHRTIGFTEEEKPIVDHPYVQRLRHVRQLGLSYIVYPGATHDRFTHGIGAMHVAGRIWDGIMSTSEDVLKMHFSAEDLGYFRRILRLAGLLHDIGHPPFSHVSEKFMPQFSALELPEGWFIERDQPRQARHEDYSVVLIGAMAKGEHASFNMSMAQDIASLVHHGVAPSKEWQERFGTDSGKRGIHRLLSSLISGELDCDRMDYLLRDSYFTGVSYGTYDIEHLVGNLGVTEVEGQGLVLTIDSTAVRAFEDFLLARYHMFLQVYLHKTTTIFDYFLDKALEDGEFTLTVPGDAEGYARLRDTMMYERLFAAAEDPKNEWSRRLIGRKPAHLLFAAQNAKADDRDLLERLAAALDADGVPYVRITSRQYLSKALPWEVKADHSASSMLVRKKLLGGRIYEPIELYSSLLNKYNEAIDLTHLYVLPEHSDAAQRTIAHLER
jgi:HD superfamily phosphohydrolase